MGRKNVAMAIRYAPAKLDNGLKLYKISDKVITFTEKTTKKNGE